MRLLHFTLAGLTSLLVFPITITLGEPIANTPDEILDLLDRLHSQEKLLLEFAPSRGNQTANPDESPIGVEGASLSGQLSRLAELPYAASTEPIKDQVLECFGLSQDFVADFGTNFAKDLDPVQRCSFYDLILANEKLKNVAVGSQAAWTRCRQGVEGSRPDSIPESVFVAAKTDWNHIRAQYLEVKSHVKTSSEGKDLIDSCLQELDDILNTAEIQFDLASIFSAIAESLFVVETKQCAATEDPYGCTNKAVNLFLEFSGFEGLFSNGDGDGR